MAEEKRSAVLETLVGKFGEDIVATHSGLRGDQAPVREEDRAIDSVIPVWAGMDWYEREAYDMYGIVFRNHPNLKRILMYESFVGYPLRKDYPKAKRQPTIGPEE